MRGLKFETATPKTFTRHFNFPTVLEDDNDI